MAQWLHIHQIITSTRQIDVKLKFSSTTGMQGFLGDEFEEHTGEGMRVPVSAQRWVVYHSFMHKDVHNHRESLCPARRAGHTFLPIHLNGNFP